MWTCFLVIVIGTASAQAGRRVTRPEQILTETFHEGADSKGNKKQADEYINITFTGTGTVNRDGLATINLQLGKIEGLPVLSNPRQKGRPSAGGGVPPAPGQSFPKPAVTQASQTPTTAPPPLGGQTQTTGQPTSAGPTKRPLTKPGQTTGLATSAGPTHGHEGRPSAGGGVPPAPGQKVPKPAVTQATQTPTTAPPTLVGQTQTTAQATSAGPTKRPSTKPGQTTGLPTSAGPTKGHEGRPSAGGGVPPAPGQKVPKPAVTQATQTPTTAPPTLVGQTQTTAQATSAGPTKRPLTKPGPTTRAAAQTNYPTKAPASGANLNASTTEAPTAGAATSIKPSTKAPTTGGPTTVAITTFGVTPTTGKPTQAYAFTEDEQMALAKHNEFRRLHQVPLMTLDREMCDQAKAYAEILAANGNLTHASSEERNGQGENLFSSCASVVPEPTERAVVAWYNEVCQPGYDFNTESIQPGTNHFTQVVWKESTTLGFGKAEATSDSQLKCAYFVARYKPAGNMIGDFLKNVPKGNFDQSYCNSIQSKRKKYFDQNGKAVYIYTPFTEILNKKKKKGFVFSSKL
ncbi:uncharacterized protein [Montipora capricornis]|uniref:uncharacterized protein n=1 Tax=Montipora capricornis TaxID=246305 RepID=UPI0035F1E65C